MQIERVQIDAIEFERKQIHFPWIMDHALCFTRATFIEIGTALTGHFLTDWSLQSLRQYM